MSKDVVRSFSQKYKLEVVKRMESGENISALAHELAIKREVLYRWRDAHRLGGPSALRAVGRPSKVEAAEMAESRSTAGNVNDLAECGPAYDAAGPQLTMVCARPFFFLGCG